METLEEGHGHSWGILAQSMGSLSRSCVRAAVTPGCCLLQQLGSVNCKQNHTWDTTRRLNLHFVCAFRGINNCALRDTLNEAACVGLQRRGP